MHHYESALSFAAHIITSHGIVAVVLFISTFYNLASYLVIIDHILAFLYSPNHSSTRLDPFIIWRLTDCVCTFLTTFLLFFIIPESLFYKARFFQGASRPIRPDSLHLKPNPIAMAGLLGGLIAPIMGPVVSGLFSTIAGPQVAPAPAPAAAPAPAPAPAPATAPTPDPAPQEDPNGQGQGQGGFNLGGQSLVRIASRQMVWETHIAN